MKPSLRRNLELISYCLMRKNKEVLQPIPRRRDCPFQLRSQHPHDLHALLEIQTPQPAASRPAENTFVEDMTSMAEQAHWNCARKGKIHVLEIFAGSARFSQCCALTGLKVGTPVDIRSRFDVMTSKGRHMVMEIIKEQAPDLILMAPVCGPWSNMQNIQQDPDG